MEEDIFIVESFLKNKEMLLKHPCWVSEKTIQAIENLINKYKELRQEVAKYEMQAGKLNQNMVSALEEAFKYSLEIKDLERQNKEQEKIIDFMIEWIRARSIYAVDSHEKLKEYFKKKAREENETN